MDGVAVVPAPPAVARDWSELPLDVLSFLFGEKLGVVDVLMGAGLVCRSWLQAAKAPDVWRSVKLEHCDVFGSNARFRDLWAMAKAAVDRSGGRLELFAGERFVSNGLLLYLAERSPALKTLRLPNCVYITDQVFIQEMKKAPLVELRHLEIEVSVITSGELAAILDGCPHLDILKMHNCHEIRLDDDDELRAKCDRIKTLSITDDRSEGCSDSDLGSSFDDYGGDDSPRSCYGNYSDCSDGWLTFWRQRKY